MASASSYPELRKFLQHADASYHLTDLPVDEIRTSLVDWVSLPKNKRYSNSTTPVFVFTGDEDNVYTPQLQERSYSRLSEAGYPVEYHTEPNCNHWEYSRNEIRCAAAWIGRVCLQRGLRVSTAVSYQRSSSPEMQ